MLSLARNPFQRNSHRTYSDILPCFFGGFLSRLVSSIPTARISSAHQASYKMPISCYNRIMIDVTQDIHSLTTFKRNSSGLMKHMKKTGRPLVLTVKGKAEAVVLDAKAYQEVASQLDAVANIRRGLAQARKGAGRPADEVFDELEREDAGR